jgi:hypothetical protein
LIPASFADAGYSNDQIWLPEVMASAQGVTVNWVSP